MWWDFKGSVYRDDLAKYAATFQGQQDNEHSVLIRLLADNDFNIIIIIFVHTVGTDLDSTGGIFTFNASSATIYTFDVPLVNDDTYEFIENFNAQLSFVEAAEQVTIDPGSAQVQVEDDDGNFNNNYNHRQKRVGFIPSVLGMFMIIAP